jgi:hypothetical protein
MTHTPAARDSSALAWFKSSYSSSGDGNDCVEIAMTTGSVHVRDSKAPHGPRLTLSPAAWAGFLAQAGRR